MPYRCGFCGDDGHNRRTCPQRIEADQGSTPTPTIQSTSDAVIITQSPVETIIHCPICMDSVGSQPMTELLCHHTFCTKCIMQNLEHGNLNCPMCRENVMGPSKKIQELEEQVQTQYDELCDQDEKLTFYEAKCESYKQVLGDRDREMEKVMSTFGFTYRKNFDSFIEFIVSQYSQYVDTIQGYDSSIVPPSLQKLLYSVFHPSNTLVSSITAIKNQTYYNDGSGVPLSHDCWVKIYSGIYRNHMARIIWKNATNCTPGYFVARVYRGLGKPKLSRGVYDCSYTEDITLWTTPGMGHPTCLISRFMVERVPNSAVTFTIDGNGVSLPPQIRTLLRQDKIKIILNRLHTHKTGGVTLAIKGLQKNPLLITHCREADIDDSFLDTIAAIQESATFVVLKPDEDCDHVVPVSI